MNESRILIVEDHPDTQLFLAQVLKLKGYTPVVHSSAGGALGEAQSNPDFKAALVDLSLEMPVEKFITALRAIGDLRDLPIIIVSGWDWTDGDAIKVGAQSFLRKPCDLPSLINALKNAIKEV